MDPICRFMTSSKILKLVLSNLIKQKFNLPYIDYSKKNPISVKEIRQAILCINQSYAKRIILTLEKHDYKAVSIKLTPFFLTFAASFPSEPWNCVSLLPQPTFICLAKKNTFYKIYISFTRKNLFWSLSWTANLKISCFSWTWKYLCRETSFMIKKITRSFIF